MKYKLLILLMLVYVVGNCQLPKPYRWLVRNDSVFMKVEISPGDSTEVHVPPSHLSLTATFFLSVLNIDSAKANIRTETDTAKTNLRGEIISGLANVIQNNSTALGRDILNLSTPASNSVIVATSGGNPILRNPTQFLGDLGAAPLNSPAITGTPTFPNGVITNNNLAGSIDLTTKVTGTLPFINGGISGAVATSATTGAMTVNMTSRIITITPTGACTFNGSGGVTGQITTFIISTSGTSSFVMTWGTNFRKVGTLATGTTSARFFSVSFICINGTTWQEISRTAAQQ